MAAQSDEELVRACQAGGLAAFAELVERHQRGIYRLALQMLNHHDDAEDATQETFIRAYRYLAACDPRRSFRNWLFAIAVNQCAHFRQRRERTRAMEVSADDPEAPLLHLVDGGRSPEEALTSKELRRKVREAVRRLPPQQRAAVALFELEGMPLTDAAEVMKCSVGAVKQHLHRARESLRKTLTPYLEEALPDEMPRSPTADAVPVRRRFERE